MAHAIAGPAVYIELGLITYTLAVAANTNLQPSLKVFVGRERELQQTAELFSAGERLVSLVGAAGIGKTRVAMRFIERDHGAFLQDGGAWFCDLTEAHTSEDICREVARALQARLPGRAGVGADMNTVGGLGDSLGTDERLLFVLDNCEQIVDDVARLLQRWMADAPNVCFLITSRERLRVPGETTIEIGPLPLPAKGDSDLASIAGCDATRLFVDRARRVVTDYQLTQGNAGIVAEIVRRLDGMPLAIELAAARVGVLSPGELLQRLDQRFKVLSSHARGVPGRHRTLRAAIDWSWDLLSEWEQVGLAQLSVFRGGFSIDAADQVVRVQTYPDAPDVVDGLQWLHDKSLVWTAGGDGNRFGLYLSVRDYAAEKLQERGLEAETFARHAAYYRQLVAPTMDEPMTTESVALLTGEEENLLAAFERAVAQAHGQGSFDDHVSLADGLACLLALEPVRATRGPWDEYAQLVTRAIDAPTFPSLDALASARSFHARGRMLGLRGQLADARCDLDVALKHTRIAGDRRLEGHVQLRLGVLANNVNDFDTACQHYERALSLFRDVGDRFAEGQALANLAVVDGQLGNYVDARRRFDEAQKLYATVGARQLQARTTGNLGTIFQDEGKLDEALLSLDRAIATLNELGNRRDAAVFVGAKGIVFQERGELDSAQQHLTSAIDALSQIGDGPFEGLFLGHLATIAATQDDLPRATRLFDEMENRWRVAPMGPGADASTLRLHKAHVELALARQAASAGDVATTEQRRQRVRELLGTIAADSEGAPPQRVRIAMRVLRQALLRDSGDAPVGDDTLVIGAQGRWFVAPRGDKVDLFKRHTLRRILVRLAEQHRDAPGRGLDLDQLFRAGWPDERVVRTAAANRVRVAVTTLRKLGLRDYLVTHSDGYLIDTTCRISMRDD